MPHPTAGRADCIGTAPSDILTTMSSSSNPATEVVIAAACWQTEPSAEAIVLRAIEAAAEAVDSDTGGAELAVMLTDDDGIQTLNASYRGFDKPTNVLSFPAPEADYQDDDGAPRLLGDIAIAYQTVRREADQDGKPFEHHLSHLAVHGFLHLIGYDHETDAEAETMEGAERSILAGLGIPDPYADQDRVS
ncbi:rRNA maturation RNase YbeY [Rhodopseudomonas palustris]|uniref:Endoribonuclease YbeY n=2 Tax=Rhodopseudomonas palustris TaxID=1076 RepID=A0A418VIP9_RHOPL|nr:rRNA maturation RNase YbeY [Rhodopseudomonas palustris]